jgi:hypothetical protein
MAGRFAPVMWILASDSSSGPLGEVSAVNAPPEFRVEAVRRIDDHRRLYRLTIEPGWEGRGRFLLELKDSSSGRRCLLSVLSTSSDS